VTDKRIQLFVPWNVLLASTSDVAIIG